MSKIHAYIDLTRLNKPIGIFLLLWPTLIALWLASNGTPSYNLLVIFSAGVLVMRSLGCVINDMADKDFDINVARTKQRPLAAKKLTTKDALTVSVLLSIIAIILALQLNVTVLMLAVIAAALATIYPFTKRFLNCPQVILGIAFAWSIPMAYMQIQQTIPLEAWILFVSTVCWVVAYDTIYAMVDKADDLLIGIKSTAITFGKYDKIMVFILQICALIGFASIGYLKHLPNLYYLGIFAALLNTLYQQSLIRSRDNSACFKAFLQNNYFGAIVFVSLMFCM